MKVDSKISLNFTFFTLILQMKYVMSRSFLASVHLTITITGSCRYNVLKYEFDGEKSCQDEEQG